MYTTLAEVRIGDLGRFLSIFATGGARLRRKHGSTRAQVFGYSEDAARAFVLIDWPDAEAFQSFRADPEVPAMMQSGGLLAPPEFRIVERVAELPA